MNPNLHCHIAYGNNHQRSSLDRAGIIGPKPISVSDYSIMMPENLSRMCSRVTKNKTIKFHNLFKHFDSID